MLASRFRHWDQRPVCSYLQVALFVVLELALFAVLELALFIASSGCMCFTYVTIIAYESDILVWLSWASATI